MCTIPNELFDNVLGYCPLSSLASCALVNSTFLNISRCYLYHDLSSDNDWLHGIVKTYAHLLSFARNISLATISVELIADISPELVLHGRLRSLRITQIDTQSDPTAINAIRQLLEISSLKRLRITLYLTDNKFLQPSLNGKFIADLLYHPALRDIKWTCTWDADHIVSYIPCLDSNVLIPQIDTYRLCLDSRNYGGQQSSQHPILPPIVNLQYTRRFCFHLSFAESGDGLGSKILEPNISNILSSLPITLSDMTLELFFPSCIYTSITELFPSIHRFSLLKSLTLKYWAGTPSIYTTIIPGTELLFRFLPPDASLQHLQIVIFFSISLGYFPPLFDPEWNLWQQFSSRTKSRFPHCSVTLDFFHSPPLMPTPFDVIDIAQINFHPWINSLEHLLRSATR